MNQANATDGNCYTIRSSLILAIFATFIFAPSAFAASPVTFEFAGIVTEGQGASPVLVGERFTGRFRFDSQIPDGDGGDPEIGFYRESPAVFSSFHVDFESFSYQLDPSGFLAATTQLNRQFDNDHVSYETSDHPVELPELPDVNFIETGVVLWAPAGTLTSDEIVTSIDVGDYSLRRLFTFYAGNDTRPSEQLVFLIQGDITSMRAVPEPSHAALSFVAILWVAFARRRPFGNIWRYGASRNCWQSIPQGCQRLAGG